MVNKKEVKLIEEKTDEKLDKKTSNQVKWFFIFLGVVLIALLLGGWVNIEAKKFDYIGLTFQKEKFGEIPIYTTQITGYGINGMPMNFKLVLRNDPSKSEIPIEGKIRFLRNSPVYISINSSSGIEECGDAIALVSYGYFMTGLGFDLKTASPDQELANERNQPFVDCSNKKDSTVVLLTSGNETKISQSPDNENCYVLSVNNCETIPLVERFEIATLAHIRGKEIN